jgi:hypothetical protein
VNAVLLIVGREKNELIVLLMRVRSHDQIFVPSIQYGTGGADEVGR